MVIILIILILILIIQYLYCTLQLLPVPGSRAHLPNRDGCPCRHGCMNVRMHTCWMRAQVLIHLLPGSRAHLPNRDGCPCHRHGADAKGGEDSDRRVGSLHVQKGWYVRMCSVHTV